MLAIVGLLAITRGVLDVCPCPGLLTHLPMVGHRPALASRNVLSVGQLHGILDASVHTYVVAHRSDIHAHLPRTHAAVGPSLWFSRPVLDVGVPSFPYPS